jgi:hypothetical protein
MGPEMTGPPDARIPASTGTGPGADATSADRADKAELSDGVETDAGSVERRVEREDGDTRAPTAAGEACAGARVEVGAGAEAAMAITGGSTCPVPFDDAGRTALEEVAIRGVAGVAVTDGELVEGKADAAADNAEGDDVNRAIPCAAWRRPGTRTVRTP